MSMRRSFRATASAVALVGAAALTLAACSSSSGSTTTTTAGSGTGSSGTASLTSLQKWPSSSVALQETGSSLLYPLFNLWTAAIQKGWPIVSITTAATGSGTGISDAANGTVNIGASDAYLSPAQVQQSPGLENIPLAISAQQINYNVPGVTGHLKLDAATLAGMYTGKITNWNDAAIAALNPGVTLPNLPVVTVHRSDGSGDTFLFTSFLYAADPTGWTVAPGTTVAFPNIPGAVAAQGNGGMVTACKSNPGCVAYIGVSYLNQAVAAGLGYAELKNKSGNFELPTQAAVSAEAAGFASKTPANGAVSMIYGPATDGYPIVNYEYAIVPTHQPSTTAAQAVKAVLAWAVDPNNGNAPTYLDQVGFVALPTQVQDIAAKLISKIS
ncbi:MAG TPA: phosphate ABC transporter substrate-binding protein PstS [Acidimicrobiales bacterium]|nr:phosphate ABC transporter substrate-binding protein PstS [Acidimicrobiales bacterium]